VSGFVSNKLRDGGIDGVSYRDPQAAHCTYVKLACAQSSHVLTWAGVSSSCRRNGLRCPWLARVRVGYFTSAWGATVDNPVVPPLLYHPNLPVSY
jgi:hypothetical protein